MQTLCFRDLRLYEVFEFADPPLRHGWYAPTGPWRKVAPRTYVHVTLGMRTCIHSGNAEVVRVPYDPATAGG